MQNVCIFVTGYPSSFRGGGLDVKSKACLCLLAAARNTFLYVGVPVIGLFVVFIFAYHVKSTSQSTHDEETAMSPTYDDTVAPTNVWHL